MYESREKRSVTSCFFVFLSRSNEAGTAFFEFDNTISFHARMVELVDTQDLKSCGQKWPCGFDPRSGYFFF